MQMLTHEKGRLNLVTACNIFSLHGNSFRHLFTINLWKQHFLNIKDRLNFYAYRWLYEHIISSYQYTYEENRTEYFPLIKLWEQRFCLLSGSPLGTSKSSRPVEIRNADLIVRRSILDCRKTDSLIPKDFDDYHWPWKW